MKTIVIRSSANFYRQANEVKKKLEKLGYEVQVPSTAEKMAKTGNYNADDYKTWYGDESDMPIKQQRMREHFDKILAGDAILVINDEKHGVKGYIGPNVLMEMGLAFAHHKPIFVMNLVGKDVSCWEEVLGMGSIFIASDLTKITF